MLHPQLKSLKRPHSLGLRVASKLSGLIQDIFTLFLQVLLLYFCKKIGIFSCAIYFLIGIIQLDILLDALMYKKAKLRFEAPFFSFVNDIRSFWDSAKEKGIAFFYPMGILFLIGICLFFYQKQHLLSFSFINQSFFLSFSLVFLLSLLGNLFLPKQLCYHLENVFFGQGIWVLKKIYAFFVRKQSLRSIKGYSEKKIFQPKAEKYTAVSSFYPLLKYTHGFSGEKQCDIALAQNEKPHIVFLFIESLRAKDVGVIKGKYDVTPCFDALSKKGVLFTDFYANSVKTTRAVTASLFGIPSDVSSSEVSSRIDMPFISLAHILEKPGYLSAYHHNGLLEFENQASFFSSYGYKNLIGRNDILQKFPKAPLTSWGVHDEYLMKYSADWMFEEDKKGKPLFLTMFTISNHHPWTIPEGYKGPNLPNDMDPVYKRYLTTTHYSDHCLGLFVKELEEKNLLQKTILFVMGDHGHPMGEHNNNFIEQRYIYEENIHVPLLILAGDKIKEPAVIKDVASQIDLIPTVMDILGIKGLNHARGSSLLRKVERQAFFHNPYVYQFYGTRKNAHKLIYMNTSKEVELYDLLSDPQERCNIAHVFPELVEEYLQDVKSYHLYYKSLYDNKLFSPFERKRPQGVVNFSKMSNLPLSKLLQELKKHPYILHLDLSSCDLLDDKTFLEMIKKHKEIRSLNLSNCKHLTGASLKQITTFCEHLQFIDLSYANFKEEDIEAFVKSGPYLEQVIQKDKEGSFSDYFSGAT